MRRMLIAAALLAAITGSAAAADVSVYGVVDLGLQYRNIDMDVSDSAFDVESLSMESGQQSASRWGLKGTEDLGGGLAVGFILEDGFTADDGVETRQMFDRESSLFIEGPFGKLAFGRMGAINQARSSWGLAGGLSAFGDSFGRYAAQIGNSFSTTGVWDNMISYATPSFAGFKAYVQYSMGQVTNTSGKTVPEIVENESSADRYLAVGATYENGPFSAFLAIDSVNYLTVFEGQRVDIDDTLTVTLGGSYDFEAAKVYLGVQYFDEVLTDSLGGIVGQDGMAIWRIDENGKPEIAAITNGLLVTGFAVNASVSVPMAGGTALFGAAYIDAKQSDFQEKQVVDDFDFTRWVVSAGYDYPLSRRTNLYAVASYMDDELEIKTGNSTWNPSAYMVLVGMKHTF